MSQRVGATVLGEKKAIMPTLFVFGQQLARLVPLIGPERDRLITHLDNRSCEHR